MPPIARLSTSLTLESQQFVVGLRKAVDQSAKTGKLIEGHLNRIRTAGAAIGVGLTVGALVAAGKRALDYASSLGEVSQQLGVTTKDLQVYRYAASQVGISQAEMDQGLAKLTRTMGEASAGNKVQIATFRELGPAVEQAVASGRTAGEVIPLIADALSKIKDPATRARIEVDLFGKAGQKLDTLLAGGRGAIDELANAAQKLGIVLSDEQIQKADVTADKLAALKQVMEARIAGVVSDNADAIYKLADALLSVATAAVQAGSAVYDFSNRFGVQIGRQLREGRFNPGQAIMGTIAEKQEQDRRARENAGLTAGRNLLRAAFGPKKGAAPRGLPVVSSGGGGRSRAASGPSDADRAANYQGELSRLLAEQLGYNQQLTTDARERAALEHQRIRLVAEAYGREKDQDVADKKLSAADAESLKLKQQRVTEQQHSLVNWELDNELAREDREAGQASLDRQNVMLQIQEQMARTVGERRAVQLQLLENELASQRLSAEEVLARQDTNKAQKERAQAIIDSLPDIRAGRTEQINADNADRGPLDDYLRATDPAKVKDRVESLVVEQLDAVGDGISDAIMGELGIKNDALKNLLDLFIEQVLIRPIALALKNAQSGTGGGLNSFLGSVVGGFKGLFGGGSLNAASLSTIAANPSIFANGTYDAPGGLAMVGELGPEMVLLPRHSRVIPNHRVNTGLLSRRQPSALRDMFAGMDHGDGGADYGGGRSLQQNWYISTPNADSFRRSERQMMTGAKRRLASV